MKKQDFKNILGYGSLKAVTQEGEKVIFTFAKDYEEYKELQPQSRVTQKEWENYWNPKWKAKCFMSIRKELPRSVLTDDIVIHHANRD